MEKINVEELLKDCPKGMELDCTMYDGVLFDYVLEGDMYPIKIQSPDGQISLTKYGCYSANSNAKCIIFPKGKTTWEGFLKPLKDCDILAYDNKTPDPSTVFIYRYDHDGVNTSYYVGLGYTGHLYTDATDALSGYNDLVRFATEEEKKRLFDAIKANGYKWNDETKTLEEFVEKCGYRFTIAEVKENHYLTKCGNKIPIDNQDDFILVPTSLTFPL